MAFFLFAVSFQKTLYNRKRTVKKRTFGHVLSEDSGQPAQCGCALRSLIRIFTRRISDGQWWRVPSHYENTPIQIYWKFYNQKRENFQIKNSNIFHISAQNIDCGYSLEPLRRGGSNEYPQSMFWAEIRKIMYTILYKSGISGGQNYIGMFPWCCGQQRFWSDSTYAEPHLSHQRQMVHVLTLRFI